MEKVQLKGERTGDLMYFYCYMPLCMLYDTLYHTGENMSVYVIQTLKDFGLEETILCITDDNAGNNRTCRTRVT